LGFAFPLALRDVGGKEGFGGNISLWDYSSPDTRKAITSNPVYKRLAIHREGREVFEQESAALYDALSKTSVLSVPVALKLMAPRFDARAGRRPVDVD
jgi:hypothetical protein